MAFDKRDRIMENLAVAAALGFLTLIVAALALVADSSAVAYERSALAPPAGSVTVLASSRVDDPAFTRMYRLQDGNDSYYGAVVSIRSAMYGTALIAASFSSKGEVKDLRLLGASADRLPAALSDIFAAFDGAGEALIRARSSARALALAATEGQS